MYSLLRKHRIQSVYTPLAGVIDIGEVQRGIRHHHTIVAHYRDITSIAAARVGNTDRIAASDHGASDHLYGRRAAHIAVIGSVVRNNNAEGPLSQVPVMLAPVPGSGTAGVESDSSLQETKPRHAMHKAKNTYRFEVQIIKPPKQYNTHRTMTPTYKKKQYKFSCATDTIMTPQNNR